MGHFRREFETIIDPSEQFVSKKAGRHPAEPTFPFLHNMAPDQLEALQKVIQQRLNINKGKNGQNSSA